MTGRFAGRVAVVTGASYEGIGRATARRLAAEGARVVLNARTPDRLDEAVGELVAAGHDAVGVVGDLVAAGTAARLVDTAVDRYGRIDLLVSNVGLGGSPLPAHRTDLAAFPAAVAGSSWAALDLVARAMDRGLADGGGAVVTVSSAVVRRLLAPTTTYAAGKIALESVTRSLALDLGPTGVRVNAVAPGQTRTEAARPMWEANEEVLAAGLPLRRLAEPAEIAAAITWLLSDDASYVTGQVLDVDGGLVLAGVTPDLRAH